MPDYDEIDALEEDIRDAEDKIRDLEDEIDTLRRRDGPALDELRALRARALDATPRPGLGPVLHPRRVAEGGWRLGSENAVGVQHDPAGVPRGVTAPTRDLCQGEGGAGGNEPGPGRFETTRDRSIRDNPRHGQILAPSSDARSGRSVTGRHGGRMRTPSKPTPTHPPGAQILGGHTCPECTKPHAWWYLDPPAGGTDGVTCDECGYTAALDEYLLATGAEETDLWTVALGWDGTVP